MSIFVSLTMPVQPEKCAALDDFLAQNVPNVRAFDGALRVELFYNDDKTQLTIFEEWQSRDHHQRYIAFISENGVMQQLLSFMQAEPVVTYHSKLAV